MPIVTRLAHRLGAIAILSADRHSPRPVPTLGGLAIALGIVVGIVLSPTDATDKVGLLVGLGAMLTLGLVDDLGTVSPRSRLLVESGVAVVFTLVVTQDLDAPMRTAAILVAAVSFPVVINATNLVDNADGLAGILSLVTALALAAINGWTGVHSVGGPIALVVAAAVVGFLLYNLPPARVFMGDSGSLMLGFSLAAASSLIVRDSLGLPGDVHKAAALVVPLAWSLQLGDIAMVFTTRIRRGASPFRGGIDHTSHRLLAAGLGPRVMLIVLACAGAGLALAGTAVLVMSNDFRLVAITAVLLGVVVGAFELYVAVRLPAPQARVDPHRTADRPDGVTRATAEQAYDPSAGAPR